MDEQNPNSEVSVEEEFHDLPQDVKATLDKLIEKEKKRQHKLLLKSRVWFDGQLISKEEWNALSWEERHRSNNLIKRAK